MSLAGKITLITGVTSVVGENFEPHEMANSLAPCLIRTRAVKRLTPKEIEAHHHYILVKRLGRQGILLMRSCSWPATRIP